MPLMLPRIAFGRYTGPRHRSNPITNVETRACYLSVVLLTRGLLSLIPRLWLLGMRLQIRVDLHTGSRDLFIPMKAAHWRRKPRNVLTASAFCGQVACAREASVGRAANFPFSLQLTWMVIKQSHVDFSNVIGWNSSNSDGDFFILFSGSFAM